MRSSRRSSRRWPRGCTASCTSWRATSTTRAAGIARRSASSLGPAPPSRRSPPRDARARRRPRRRRASDRPHAMAADFALWRRLDAPGHDVCRLEGNAAGWQLNGTAIYRDHGVLARLDYEVACDSAWITRHGRVRGWLGARVVDFVIVRSAAGAWTL